MSWQVYLTGTAVHRSQVFSELLSDAEVHDEVLEGGEGADFHGPRGRIVGDLFGGFQQAHDLPQGEINIWKMIQERTFYFLFIVCVVLTEEDLCRAEH